MRKDKLFDMKKANKDLQAKVLRDYDLLRTTQKQQEKEWVNSLLEIQRTEDACSKEKKLETSKDLRQEYAAQTQERREQKELSFKCM